MSRDLISKKTRFEFREYFVGTILREIEMEFDAADIPWDETYQPNTSGARRSLVEQYYHSLDFSKWTDVRKILIVYQNVLASLDDMVETGSGYDNGEYAKKTFVSLRKWIERDGFTYQDGRLIPTGKNLNLPHVSEAVKEFDVPELHRQIERMQNSVDDDPGLAVGTAKELLETTCKTILTDLGVEYEPNWDVLVLTKETRKVLKLLPEDIPDSAKGADVIRRLLSNLGTLVQGLSELRNLYGTGHGREGKAQGVTARHARLAVGAAATLATFLFETHQERTEKTKF